MLKPTIITLFVLYGFYTNAQTHVLTKKWDYTYGGTAVEELWKLKATKDGGVILGGSSFSGVGGDKTQANWDPTNESDDFWVVKLDSNGKKEWDRRFGGNDHDGFSTLYQTKDSGYILGGLSYSGISGDKTEDTRGGSDMWLVKIDAKGNYQWDKRYGGSLDETVWDIRQTADNGYIFGGVSNSGISGDKSEGNWNTSSFNTDDFWVVKTDSIGGKQWDRRYGGTRDELFLASVLPTNDGGYILGGTSASDSSGDKTQNNWDSTRNTFDYWIIKIDGEGKKQWDKTFGSVWNDWLYTILQTPDGGYMLGGMGGDKTGNKKIEKGDFWIIKLDSAGTDQWENAYEGGANFTSMVATLDGGYLLSGTAESDAVGDTDKTEPNLGHIQGWMIKIDSLGSKQWDKTVFSLGTDDGGYAVQTRDGCYAIAMGSNAGIGGYKTQPPVNSSPDYWIVKFCDTLITGITEVTGTGAQVTISPNPFTTDIAIGIQKEGLKEATFTITNLLGQPVYTRKENNLTANYTKMLDLSYLTTGIYFVEVTIDGERVVREIVKE